VRGSRISGCVWDEIDEKDEEKEVIWDGAWEELTVVLAMPQPMPNSTWYPTH
jgi:hypothetical protein